MPHPDDKRLAPEHWWLPERERRAEGTRIAIKLGRRRAWHGGPKSGYTPAKARAF
ncbi:MAG: hypothetical protein JWQ52_1472 [Phenylobacterium sp.]|jgi:hypothetical protein|nr:hypothetical protein [Phenylobacterium sp.]